MAAAYTSMQGTVFWMAPEVVNSKGKGYNSKIDIWSVGCVVFEMWTGQRPWTGQEAMAVLLHVSSFLLLLGGQGTYMAYKQLYQTKQAPPVPDGIALSELADDFRLKCFAAYVPFNRSGRTLFIKPSTVTPTSDPQRLSCVLILTWSSSRAGSLTASSNRTTCFGLM